MKKRKKERIYLLKKGEKINEDILRAINELVEVLSPGKGTFDHSRFEELLNNPMLDMYLLEVEDKIVGMGGLHYVKTLVKESAWVEAVAIHPDHQRKGLGKKIMDHIINEAKKKNVNYIELTTRPARVAANSFYRKLKFELRETNVYRLKL